MVATEPAGELFPEHQGREDLTRARLAWLIRLRWVAMAGVLCATVLAATGAFPGVAWPVLAAVAVAGALYNFWLFQRHRRVDAPTGRRSLMVQALVDLLLLTVVLWAAGGIRSPFMSYYVFHVALIGILGGARAALLAAAASVAGAALLWGVDVYPALQVGRWNPPPPWDTVAEVAAFVTTVMAAAYIVTHAVRELHDRERALARARDRAALEYQVLSNTLDELEAGLEVVDGDGHVLWRNKRAEQLAPRLSAGDPWACPGAHRACEKDATGVCPVSRARDRAEPGRCRFAADTGQGERVYEMLVFPLPGRSADEPRVMNLYVDRTHVTLAERQLVLAERLASLGRVAQGVAHELNTPLATIRTLAADMRAALRELSAGGETGEAAAEDLDESAELIQDETRRLGRITQALLAGGDLVRARIDGAVPLAAVVERARALVFAGARRGPEVQVDPSVDRLRVTADPDRLMQVLVNLLQNAHDAVGGRDDALVLVRATQSGDRVEIMVEDDGVGIDPAIEARLFEPFATSKPPGQGTGLGLYTSYMLVRAMGGELDLERREGQGSRAVLRLSAATEEAQRDGVAGPATLSQRAAG
jgi:C4-dicarboxylate-specific signal transduction histidine kinase